jgi:RPA family protein
MSADGDDSGPGRREVAHRLFATEFDDATVSYAESDEERAPKYVVTPTGARVNRLFAVGVLTEVESVNEDVLRARVVDPTGAFVSYAGQYQPDSAAFFERADPPAFVALTGKARTFEPDDGNRIYTSVRPESVSVVDGETRDRWTVSAAEATLRRVATMAEAKSIDASGEALDAALTERGYDESLASGIAIALDRYGTTTAYLDAVREVALDALAVVTGDREAVRSLDVTPDDVGTESLGPMPAGVTGDAAGEAEGAAEPTASSTDAATEPVDATTTAEGADDGNTVDDTTTPESTESASTPAERDDGVTTEASADDASTGDDVGATAGGSDASEPGVDDATDPTEDPAGGGGDIGDFDDGPGDFDDDDDLYELDEEERREVEEEFDVGFESGAEVDDPGEAGIDVPEPEDLDAADAVGTTAAEGGDAGDVEADTGDADIDADEEAGVPDDVDLETAAVEVMEDLDDGDGADREAVVAAVVDEYGADPGGVEDAIEDALMSGRCYEPTEDRLKAI